MGKKLSAECLKSIKNRMSIYSYHDVSGCTIWIGSRNNRGYGVVWFNGKLRLAHRVSWYLSHNKWPDKGLVIDHICCDKRCINPKHLRELTNWRNIRRAYQTDDPAVNKKREAWRKSAALHRGNYSDGYVLNEGGD